MRLSHREFAFQRERIRSHTPAVPFATPFWSETFHLVVIISTWLPGKQDIRRGLSFQRCPFTGWRFHVSFRGPETSHKATFTRQQSTVFESFTLRPSRCFLALATAFSCRFESQNVPFLKRDSNPYSLNTNRSDSDQSHIKDGDVFETEKLSLLTRQQSIHQTYGDSNAGLTGHWLYERAEGVRLVLSIETAAKVLSKMATYTKLKSCITYRIRQESNWALIFVMEKERQLSHA